MKKYIGLFLILILSLFIFTGCLTKPDSEKLDEEVLPLYTIHSNIENGSTVIPNSVVVFKLTDNNNQIVESTLKLYKDGKIIKEEKAFEHFITVVDEGFYSVNLISSDSAVTKTFEFKVTNLEKEVYQDGGTWHIETFSSEFLYYSTIEPTTIHLRFYKYVEEKLEGTNEVISKQVRLNPIDTNNDKIYDNWNEIPLETAPATISFVSYIEDTETNTTWRADKLFLSEDNVKVYYLGIDGDYKGYYFTQTLVYKGFELNTYYRYYLYLGDDIYKSPTKIDKQFILRERYNSDDKPVFSLKSDISEVATDSELKVTINAKNVADFAKLYDVRYMQLAVKYSKYLTLENVEFPEFMDGYADFSSYKISSGATSVILYKGFTLDTDETEPASENFAVLTFKVSNDATGTLKINLAYEGYLDDYDTYIDVPNPIFKDKDNANVDGFIVDHTDLSVAVSGGDEE
ncbi:hypothetical protein Marpi_0768 [Marinitoga piezophila KA3]|uniref:Uncharacterized protein n=1 Tax=Marinitoga piezophila (strain DSM 14283 / JCM 11233 / KA3) TaxID=443254 RepID=H2J6L3_MARPK|nr:MULTISPECIES: cohesin domain-containing protein [Marinitoga]AEX85198.1 hypothetical protein Marpi_0768 [Marinitoga piezophila KA3]